VQDLTYLGGRITLLSPPMDNIGAGAPVKALEFVGNGELEK